MSSTISAVGVDLGSLKTMVVADDGEIIRTSTGWLSAPYVKIYINKSFVSYRFYLSLYLDFYWQEEEIVW
jgi:hypothetical protein